jgi:type IV secretion system protein VirB5
MRRTLPVVLLTTALICAPPTQAMIPVIDLSAILQLLMQFQKLEDQLVTAKNQLTQARDTLSAMKGDRGMESLLSGTNRNSLPASWNELSAALTQTSSAYGALSSEARALIQERAILTDAQIAHLTPAQRAVMLESRQHVAGFAALSREAVAHTSQRFAAIQQLIDAIPTAADQKAILDLQARIGAETTMMQNDTAKLESLYQVAQSQDRLRTQQLKEAGIADIGSLRSLPPMGL